MPVTISDPFANRYAIERELGRGAFGVVYLASDLRLRGRPVALKILHPVLSTDPGVVRLFQNEAGVLATLQHDHIVTVHDADVWEDRRYIVMAFVDGPSLAQIVKEQGAQPPELVATWLRQAASALAYAHGQGVLHRDIKPANLLLDRVRHRVVITDFGLARVVDASGGTSLQGALDVLTGTAAYRAPEVVKTGHTVASDLYGLGVVGYELLAGRMPFVSDDPLSLMMLHASEPPPALPESTPPGLADLVAQLLAKSPYERPPSAAALVDALDVSYSRPAETRPAVQQSEPAAPSRLAPEVVAVNSTSEEATEPVTTPAAAEDDIAIAHDLSSDASDGPVTPDQPTDQLGEGAVSPSSSEQDAAPPVSSDQVGQPLAHQVSSPVDEPQPSAVAGSSSHRRLVGPLLVFGALLVGVALLVVLRGGTDVPLLASVITAKTATPTIVVASTNTVGPTNTPTVRTAVSAMQSPTPRPDAVVNVTNVNLRSGPGTEYARLATYRSNTAVYVIARNATSDWLKVRTPDNKSGWMARNLLRVNANLSLNSLPVASR